jgi:hypothetical protein
MLGGTAAQPLGAGTSTLASQGALPAAPHAHAGTMLGLAVPGVAPLAATMPLDGGPAPVGLSPANQDALGARKPVRGKLANTALSDMAYLPPPAPYVDDVPMPAAPPVRSRSGVPLTLVAAVVSGLVLLVGGAVLFLYRSAPPLTAKPQLDAQDNEVLHLQCESCADGTTVTLDGAKATFRANQTDLALAVPLKVGNNDVALTLDRPGAGRDEQVKLVVPLAFRIRADLSQIDAKPPTILVRVAAAPGSDVTVDKKPLTLDSSGTGSYAIDVSADTDGPTEDVRLIDRRIDYTITAPAHAAAKGVAPSSGQVTARVAVVPLRVDAPGAHAIVDGASFTIAGQTLAGGTVSVDGQPATVLVRRDARGHDGPGVDRDPRERPDARATERARHGQAHDELRGRGEGRRADGSPTLDVRPDRARHRVEGRATRRHRGRGARSAAGRRPPGHRPGERHPRMQGGAVPRARHRVGGREARARPERPGVRHGDARRDDVDG